MKPVLYLILGGMALVLLFEVGLHRVYLRLLLDRQAAQVAFLQVEGCIRVMDTALLALPAAQQPVFASQMTAAPTPGLVTDTALHERLVTPREGLAGKVAEEMRARNDRHPLMQEADSGALFAGFDVQGRRYWLRIPWQPAPPAADAWLLQAVLLALSLGAASGVLLVLTRNARSSIRELVHAARVIENGHVPPPLRSSARGDLGRLLKGFNTMTRSIQSFERERSLILAGISHDVRTPLTRLRLGLEIISSQVDFQLMEGMIQDVEDMDAILEQFLGYVRDGSDEKPRLGDLNELIREICHRYDTAGYEVTAELTPIKQFRFRHLAMRRMITNVVDNAVKYGGSDVTVRTHKNAEYAFIHLLDRGPGVPESDLGEIIQPYVRSDSSRNYHNGAGLGLTIASRIARAHAGKLSISNREGGGLEVCISIPYVSHDRVPGPSG